MRGCRWLNTPVQRCTGCSALPSVDSWAQHTHWVQNAHVRCRALNTPVRYPVSSTQPCEVSEAQHPLRPDPLASSMLAAYLVELGGGGVIGMVGAHDLRTEERQKIMQRREKMWDSTTTEDGQPSYPTLKYFFESRPRRNELLLEAKNLRTRMLSGVPTSI
ncbi:hypothetical protein J6590_073746 [Homalodisca vitripennis]|nr:hypothetical protein J6590_073746 [Homalodisca vitripennis]